MNDKNLFTLITVWALVILIGLALLLQKHDMIGIKDEVKGVTAGIVIREIDDKYICFTYFNKGISCLRKEDK